MSSGNQVDVQWSPVSADQFLTWSRSDLHLYQVCDVSPDEDVAPKLRLCSKTAATLLVRNTDYQYIRSVSWCPGPKQETASQLLAIGQTGKVALTNFQILFDPQRTQSRDLEYVSKHNGPVNTMAWSLEEPKYLAVAFEKAGKDPSLVILDVTRISSQFYDQTGTSGGEISADVSFCPGETTHSVAFSLHTPRTVVAGLNNKHIRIFDIKEKKQVSYVGTKAVYGICQDPTTVHRFASYVDNVVNIWDVRRIDRPLLPLSLDKPVKDLAWCPTRSGFLAALCHDSTSIRLHDIQHQSTGREDQEEPAVIHRSAKTHSNSTMFAFSWHPHDERRILTASSRGELVDYTVHERVMFSWSTTKGLVWTHGRKTFQHFDAHHPAYEQFDDISTLIIARAQKGYGLATDNLAKNGEIASDRMLQNLWSWMEEARSLYRANLIRSPGRDFHKYQGVLSLLTTSQLKSDIINKSWIGLDGAKTVHKKVFRSDERMRALELCKWGWSFDKDALLSTLLKQLESNGYFTRAAAVAVFNLRIRQAIQILQRGAMKKEDPSLYPTAMALAGFSDDRKGLWRDTCINLRSELADPYLKAAFAFLTDEADSFDPILQETAIEIRHRVAFACLYLSDMRIVEYLRKLTSELTNEGNLDGILLTGLYGEGINLLQMYLDVTGDVQTPALITIHGLQHLDCRDPRPELWVESYRELLDNLHLWNERAKQDLIMNQQSRRPPQSIYIKCHLCSKSISSYLQTPPLPRSQYVKSRRDSKKITSCPSCHKPLPRCSLCLQHMGTASEHSVMTRNVATEDGIILDHSPPRHGSDEGKSATALNQFSMWFSWCQKCRHGGHASHMIEWFKEHTDCPIPSCNCKCVTIDQGNNELLLL